MSFYKLTYADNKIELNKHEEVYGRYNSPLPNMVEINHKEFASSGFFTWSFRAFEFRQIDPNEMKKTAKLLKPLPSWLMSAQIFYVGSPNEDGFVLINDQSEKTIRYFRFAKCHHTYVEVSGASLSRPQWNCYHYYKCTKCGEINEVDSSG